MNERKKQNVIPATLITSLEYINQLSKEAKLQLAQQALGGELLSNIEIQDDQVKKRCCEGFLYWLKWVQSDEKATKIWWEWITTTNKLGKDKDDYILELWNSVDSENGKNKFVREYLLTREFPWSYYKRHFFNWFLERFHVVNARKIFTNSKFVPYLHIPLSVLSIFLTVIFFIIEKGNINVCHWLVFCLIFILLFLTSGMLSGISPYYFFQSLIPRIGITTGVGYLYLFSAAGLVRPIYSSKFNNIEYTILGLVIIIAIMLYIIGLMCRRVHPNMKFVTALERSIHLITSALMFSAIGLFLCAPIFFSSSFLSTLNMTKSDCIPLRFGQLFILSTIALAIGVILQLVWEDKPVTEPL